MIENTFWSKRASSGRQPALFRRGLPIAIVFFVSIVLFFFLLPSLPTTPPTIPQSQASVSDWHSCNGEVECCARMLSPATRPHLVVTAIVRLPGGGNISWPMAVHPDSDIVSWEVRRTGTWDGGKTLAVLTSLRGGGESPVFFDVGANIGWFTLAMANAGYSTFAVEPFAENLAILRHSLCLANDQVRGRVKVIPYALGNRDRMKCELWQRATHNRGDTFTVCDGTSSAQSATSMREYGHKKLGEALVRRLDVLIANKELVFPEGRKMIMKMDVEGFEFIAMQGALEFLAKCKPSIIFSEYGEKMIRRAVQTLGASVEESSDSPKRFLDFMTKAGYEYKISGDGRDEFWGLIQEAVFTRKSSA